MFNIDIIPTGSTIERIEVNKNEATNDQLYGKTKYIKLLLIYHNMQMEQEIQMLILNKVLQNKLFVIMIFSLYGNPMPLHFERSKEV